MPPLSEFFGSLERLLGDLYPYRYAGSGVLLVLAGAIVAWLWRSGWGRAALGWASAHRGLSAVLVIAAVAMLVPLGSYTLSPLWERSSLDEASPLEVLRPADAAAPAAANPSAAATAPQSPAAGGPAGARVLRQGMLAGADAFHFGRGDVLLVDDGAGGRVLRFEGLSVRNGPDLFVYLSDNPEDVRRAVNLGGLKATDGSFNYEVPAQIEGATLDYALIWCRQFGVLFASAPLAPGS
jgi:hypothetical protein